MAKYSAEWFKNILDSMSDLVLVKGKASKILWANKAFLSYYGMSEEELESLIDAPHSDPDDTLQYVKDDSKVFEIEKDLDISSEAITGRNGEILYFHTIKSPIFVKDQMTMSVGISRLLKDQKQFGTNTPHQYGKDFTSPLRVFISNYPVPTILLDFNCRIVETSDAWIDCFGVVTEKIALPGFFDNYKLMTFLNDTIKKTKNDGKRQVIGHDFSDGNTDKKHFKFKTSTWNFPDGELGGFIVTASDVTELESKDKQINDLNNRLTLAMSTSRIGVWEWNIDSNELIWDEQMYGLYGVAKGDFSGAYGAWESGLHPDDKRRSEEELNKAVEGHTKFDTSFRIYHPDGSIRTIRAIAEVVYDPEKNKPSKVIGVNWDITKEINDQEELKAAKLLAERSDRSKSLFLATMSHEIRTPMNGVMGMIELLSESELNNEQKEMIKTLKGCSDSLLTILNDILDFSKIESGKFDINNEPFDLRATVNDVVQILAPTANAKNIDLATFFNISDDLYVSDQLRFRQIFLNLLSNALKFTEKGFVRLSLEEVEKRVGWSDLVIKVEDSGIGIADNEVGKLFQTFSQLDAGSTRSVGGSGLGLSICKRIAKAMGGDICYEKSKNGGSIFKFTVSLEQVIESKSKVVVDHEIMTNSYKMKGLIVDDNEINRNLVSKFLEKYNLKFDIAVNGLEALEMTKDCHYDLILMDIQMPVMDGIEATMKILESVKALKPRIYALTANVFKEDCDQYYAAGMDGILAKPLRRKDLETVLDNVLDIIKK
jgi:PAS domain S-box-containing protein